MAPSRRRIPWPLVLLLAVIACAPVTVSRIGPDLPPRRPGCLVEVLDPGGKPSRPHLAVGMVTLEHCQDYRAEPCRGWLVDAACRLGGHVAFLDDGGRPDSGLGPMVFWVTVAAYVSDSPGGGGSDPFEEEMRRRRSPPPDCGDGPGDESSAADVDRCVE